jgi:hypothetical protein
LNTTDAHDRRPLILLGVLVSHAVVVLLLIRAARQPIFPQYISQEPLVLMYLHDGVRAITQAVSPRPRARLPPMPSATAQATTPPPQAPPPAAIDWEQQAELAARNGVAAEKQKDYRDLSALSPEQLSWIRNNHMQPATPGIPWTHPRFEFDAHSGLPVFWINDRCVLVMLMVFCGVGHREASGDLFKHMDRSPAP